jgi:hypothetical protein
VLLGGLIALRFTISGRLVGLVMAFGAGVLISAVAFTSWSAFRWEPSTGRLISGTVLDTTRAVGVAHN